MRQNKEEKGTLPPLSEPAIPARNQSEALSMSVRHYILSEVFTAMFIRYVLFDEVSGFILSPKIFILHDYSDCHQWFH